MTDDQAINHNSRRMFCSAIVFANIADERVQIVIVFILFYFILFYFIVIFNGYSDNAAVAETPNVNVESK
jgi:hypothetical protein